MASPALARVPPETIKQSLNRILASQGFRRAATLRRLLSYVVETALGGKPSQIKEYSLGVAVFGRGERFDCRFDPIVRVQARKLRARLRQYYLSEGSLDPVVIDIPKGTYSPIFRHHNVASAAQAVPPSRESSTETLAHFDAYAPRSSHRDPVLRLINLVYEAAQDSQFWPHFLEQLANAIHGETTVLLAHDYRHTQTSVVQSVRIDPSYESEFNEYYSKINPWTIRGRRYLAPAIVFTGQMACSDEEFATTEYYNDYLRRLGLFHSMGATIAKQADSGSFVSSLRPRAAGPFGETEMRILQELLPHLRRALELHRTLALLEGERDASAGALEHLPYGCALLDGKRKVLRANGIALDIFREKDGLELTKGCLAAADPRESRKLDDLICEAAKTALGQGFSPGGTMSISRPSGRSSYLAVASPVHSGAFFLGERQAFVALFLSNPEREPPNHEETIARLFGLTPAEARLASLLAKGAALGDVADRLAIGRNTAKTHVHRIFEKTGTNRQAELVRLLLSTPFLSSRAK